MRAGGNPQQIGRKGVSNHRWIVGGTLCKAYPSTLTAYKQR